VQLFWRLLPVLCALYVAGTLWLLVPR